MRLQRAKNLLYPMHTVKLELHPVHCGALNKGQGCTLDRGMRWVGGKSWNRFIRLSMHKISDWGSLLFSTFCKFSNYKVCVTALAVRGVQCGVFIFMPDGHWLW